MAETSVLNSKKSYAVDMCHGPLTGQIIRFVIPLMISGVLQLCFHSADLIVIGRLASHRALAAVGATVSLSALLINIFIGLSIGTNVLAARYLGEHKRRKVFLAVHTAVMTGIIGGIILAVIGIVFAKPMLRMMDTPGDILDMSTLYMQICFGGMPMLMLYNFGSAVLRAMGDTTRPFYFLLIGGVINVLLNLFFVIVFKWDVAGVATATVISQGVSALLVLYVLCRMRGSCRVFLKRLSIDRNSLKEMMWIGIPAGFQASCFSLSNILIQSSINTFGSAAIAGMTAAGSWENLSYIAVNAIGMAAVSFVGQNLGGRKFDRIRRANMICIVMACICSLVISAALLIFGRELLSVFNNDHEVLHYGVLRFRIVVPLLFVCSLMEVVTGTLRGLGHSVAPSVITVFCVCVLRVIWIFTVFRWYPTMEILLASYPLTWLINAGGLILLQRHVLKKVAVKI